MNSKLPPKYTFLFLLLFVFYTNKGEPALSESAKLYSAVTVISSKAFSVYSPPSIVTDNAYTIFSIDANSGLESYQWFMNMGVHIRS